MRTSLQTGVLAALAAWGVACASPSPAWLLTQAEQKLAAGESNQALQYTERAIHMGHATPSADAIALHLRALRALGRDAEADAFFEFVRRYDAGEDTYSRETPLSWRRCLVPRSGGERLQGWKWRGLYEIGTIAAAFQIERDGSVRDIHVLRARHPAAAWLGIAAVGNAGLPPIRLEEVARDADRSFPVELCVWLTQDAR